MGSTLKPFLAAIFGLSKDAHLHGTQYSWLGKSPGCSNIWRSVIDRLQRFDILLRVHDRKFHGRLNLNVHGHRLFIVSIPNELCHAESICLQVAVREYFHLGRDLHGPWRLQQFFSTRRFEIRPRNA